MDLENTNYTKVINKKLKKCGYCGKELKPKGYDYLYANISADDIEYERCDCKNAKEYWEKEDTKRPYDGVRNDYVLKDTCDSYTDRTGADDYYTILGNNFKFSIPFSIFESIDRRIAENAERLLRKGLYESKEQLYEWALERVGYKAAMTRRALNG